MSNFFYKISNINSVATFIAIFVALMIGSAVPIYVGLMGGKVTNLLVPPILLMFVIFLALDRKMIIIAIILFRSIGDILLESTQTSLGGMTFSIGALINIVVLLIAFLLVLEKPKLFPTKLALFWLPFMIIALFGVVLSPVKADAIRTYLTILSYFAIFIIAVYLVRTPADFNKSIRLVVWSSVLPVIYGIIDTVLHMRGSEFRLQSTFAHPNIFAFYLVLVISLSLYLIKTKITPLKTFGRACVTFNMILMLAELLLTQTRSAWVACFVIFLSYALFFERKYLFYLLLLPIVVLLVPSVRDRLANLNSSNEVYQYAELNSFSWRVSIWESALRWMEAVKYITGYGLDSFKYHSRTFFLKAGTTNWGAHNVYVQIVFEIGILGLMSFLALFVNITKHLKTLLKKENLGFFVLMALIAEYLVVAGSDNTLAYLVFNWYFFFALGAGCSLVNLHSDSMKKDS
jgi:O-antigen ligase